MRQAPLCLLLLGCSEPQLREIEFAPTVHILGPSDGGILAQGAPATFLAEIGVQDYDLSIADLVVTWTSDLDGDLTPEAQDIGAGTIGFTRAAPLSIGVHALTVEALAPNGTEPGKDKVHFTVVEDTPPTVAFTAPDEGVYVAFDAPVSVSAEVADAEQAPDSLVLDWTLDGQPVGDGPAEADAAGQVRHTFDGLALGRRTIALRATDAAGVGSTATLHVVAVEPDADEDGAVTSALGGPDCDDTDASVHPDADEVCNDLDDDCDTLVDDDDGDLDAASATPWHPDADLDLWGDAATTVTACDAPTGWLEDGSDCADADPSRHPAASEVCNGLDDDCDGAIPATETDDDGDGWTECAGDCDDADAAAHPGAEWWPDADADGYGDAASAPTVACERPPGFADAATDCDDLAPLVNPGAPEVCNGGDDDCDGLEDDADPDLEPASADTFHRDLDGDTYGDPSVTIVACEPLPPLWIADGTDCDDGEDEVHPGAVEVCNEVDDDCDTLVDDADPDLADGLPWYVDADGDAWGDEATVDTFCVAPPGRVDRGSDCADDDAAVNPAATEVCNLADDDCDGLADDDDPSLFDPTAASGDFDADGDTWGVWRDMVCDTRKLATSGPDSDCNDSNAAIFPGQVEDCSNGLDDDCSGDSVACRYAGEYVVESDLLAVPVAVLRGDDGTKLGSAIDTALDASGAPVVLVGAGSSRGGAYVFSGPIVPGAEYGLADATLSFVGTQTGAHLGTAVALGDLDDDGLLDYVIGAPDADDTSGVGTGAVFLFAGRDVDSGSYEAAAATATFYGVDVYDSAGTAIVVGDLTCDGVDDLLVTAPSTSSSAKGAVYVFFGPLWTTGAVDLGVANVVIQGDENADRLGDAVDLVRDPSGAVPCAGLVIGASHQGDANNRGAAYVFGAGNPAWYGLDADTSTSQSVLSAGSAWAVYRGVEAGQAGAWVAALPDYDGDGFDGIAIGAPGFNDLTTGNAGEGHAYLVFDPEPGVHDLDGALAPTNVVTLRNGVASGAAGTVIAPVGDLDGDGWEELVVTAVDHDGGGVGSTGGAYLYYGERVASLTSSALQDSADAGFLGLLSDRIGDAVHAVPDIDGDGIDDLAVSAVANDEGAVGNDQGAVYLVFGTTE